MERPILSDASVKLICETVLVLGALAGLGFLFWLMKH